jgi:hypothetical protein
MTFDFQRRPVGHYRNRGSILLSLRFKDMVSIHAPGREILRGGPEFSKDRAGFFTLLNLPASLRSCIGDRDEILKRNRPCEKDFL